VFSFETQRASTGNFVKASFTIEEGVTAFVFSGALSDFLC
jgi:hypothetical protein